MEEVRMCFVDRIVINSISFISCYQDLASCTLNALELEDTIDVYVMTVTANEK